MQLEKKGNKVEGTVWTDAWRQSILGIQEAVWHGCINNKCAGDSTKHKLANIYWALSMCHVCYRILHVESHLICTATPWDRRFLISMYIQIKKRRHREVTYYAQSHKITKPGAGMLTPSVCSCSKPLYSLHSLSWRDFLPLLLLHPTRIYQSAYHNHHAL